MHFKYEDVNHAFNGLVEGIYSGKIPTYVLASRVGEAAQIEEPVIITYEKPMRRVLFNSERDANPMFHVYESLWMLAGRNDIAPLNYYSSNYAKQVQDGDSQRANGAYGYRWRHSRPTSGCMDTFFDTDQINVLLDHLNRKPESRRAVLQMWNSEDDLMQIGRYEPCKNCVNGKWQNGRGKAMLEEGANCPYCKGAAEILKDYSKDVCCNLSAHFMVEQGKCSQCNGKGTIGMKDINDDERIPCPRCGGQPHDQPQFLNMTVFNRSNDMIWGALGANLVHFSFLLEYMAISLGLEVGRYHQVSNNMHVYTERFEALKWLGAKNAAGYAYYNLAENCKMVPLVKDRATFDKECAAFVSLNKDGKTVNTEWSEPFLHTVAQPMCHAFHYHKQRDYKAAHTWVDNIAADDWRIVSREWIGRREDAYYRKKNAISTSAE